MGDVAANSGGSETQQPSAFASGADGPTVPAEPAPAPDQPSPVEPPPVEPPPAEPGRHPLPWTEDDDDAPAKKVPRLYGPAGLAAPRRGRSGDEGSAFGLTDDELVHGNLGEPRVIGIGRVAKVVKGGRRFSFTALVVVGDGAGFVGVGYGKAREVPVAIDKAANDARKKLFRVPLARSTIVHEVVGEAGAGRVKIRPAAPGTGVIAGGAARMILEEAGVRDVLCKSLGSRNRLAVARATVAGLQKVQDPWVVAQRRGLALDDFAPAALHRSVTETRQRRDGP